MAHGFRELARMEEDVAFLIFGFRFLIREGRGLAELDGDTVLIRK